MKKSLLLITFLSFLGLGALAQKQDTLVIDASNVNPDVLKTGTHRYLVYFRNGKDSSRVNYQMWTRKIDRINYQGKPAISITQEWEDNKEIVHKVYSVSDSKSFKPLFHESWWKTRGSSSFDFITKKGVTNGVALTETDTTRMNKLIYGAFSKALNEDYFLNWHLDLETFPILPYKDKTTFVINFYDPGLSAPSKQMYTVTGSAVLEGFNDQKIDCWLLTHETKNSKEVFWISKKTREVLKLEQEFNGRFRYKIKLGFSV